LYNNCLFEGSPYEAARAWTRQHGLASLRFITSFSTLDGPISLCLILRSENSSQTQALEYFDHTTSTAETQLQGVSSVNRNALPLAPRGLADLFWRTGEGEAPSPPATTALHKVKAPGNKKKCKNRIPHAGPETRTPDHSTQHH
jgi:hypothetical protein